MIFPNGLISPYSGFLFNNQYLEIVLGTCIMIRRLLPTGSDSSHVGTVSTN